MNAGVPAELVRGRWDKEIAELLGAELVQWRNGRLSRPSAASCLPTKSPRSFCNREWTRIDANNSREFAAVRG